MMSSYCAETRLDESGYRRVCVLDTGHEGEHMDARGVRWEPPGATLQRLRARWGHTHRIVWTGALWMATAHNRTAQWRTEIEPTPQQLEERLQHRAHPPAPARRLF
jgi:hypothetical protein